MVNNHYSGEEPNAKSRRFVEMLDAEKQHLYKGCRYGHSPLSSTTRLMVLR